MAKNKLLLFLVLGCVFLSSCTDVPTMLGVSELEWSSYSPEKQKKLLANYKQVVQERENIIAAQENVTSGDIFFKVGISGGKIMFPPAFINWQRYKPVRFTVLPGQCTNVEMVHQTDDDVKTQLEVCFFDHTLYLDPSRHDLTQKAGSISINVSPLWLTGFTYKGVDSTGYVKLSNVNIKIKQGKMTSGNAVK